MMENIDIHTVVNAMLVHVPFDGWTDKAMEAAVQDLNLSADDLAKLFPRGAISAVEAFVSMSDQDMIKAFAALEHRPDGVTAIIKTLIMIRLDAAAPHREAVSRALQMLARPQHAPVAVQTLYRSIDCMWRIAGDRSVDFNFYSKRILLAGVYSATLAYWVANPGADHDKLDQFISRRLREVSFLPKVTAPARHMAKTGMKMAGRMMGRLSPPWVRS